VIGFIAFGALVALGFVHNRRKRREAIAQENIARLRTEQEHYAAARKAAEAEIARLTAPARPGRPRKTRP
jgi:hypothetical protein